MIRLLLAVLLLLPACSHSRRCAKVDPIIRKPRAEVCLWITSGRSGGTAFLCRWNGKVGLMTAWHIVGKQSSSMAKVSGCGVTREVLFSRVGVCDMAWAEIKAPPPEWKILEVGPDAQVGDSLQSWGYGGGALQMRSGNLLFMDARPRLRKDSDNVCPEGRYIMVDSGVEGGMSGGPVLDYNGRVVAVVVISIRESSITFSLDGQMISQEETVMLVAVDIP